MHTYYATVLLNELPEIITMDAKNYEEACQSAFASYGADVLDVTIAPTPEDFDNINDNIEIELPF